MRIAAAWCRTPVRVPANGRHREGSRYPRRTRLVTSGRISAEGVCGDAGRVRVVFTKVRLELESSRRGSRGIHEQRGTSVAATA